MRSRMGRRIVLVATLVATVGYFADNSQACTQPCVTPCNSPCIRPCVHPCNSPCEHQKIAAATEEMHCPPNCGELRSPAAAADPTAPVTAEVTEGPAQLTSQPTAYGVWAWRFVTHLGCGGGTWYYVELGAWNALRCPYDGYMFSAFISG